MATRTTFMSAPNREAVMQQQLSESVETIPKTNAQGGTCDHAKMKTQLNVRTFIGTVPEHITAGNDNGYRVVFEKLSEVETGVAGKQFGHFIETCYISVPPWKTVCVNLETSFDNRRVFQLQDRNNPRWWDKNKETCLCEEGQTAEGYALKFTYKYVGTLDEIDVLNLDSFTPVIVYPPKIPDDIRIGALLDAMRPKEGLGSVERERALAVSVISSNILSKVAR